MSEPLIPAPSSSEPFRSKTAMLMKRNRWWLALGAQTTADRLSSLGSALLTFAVGCSGSPTVHSRTSDDRAVVPATSAPTARPEGVLSIEGEGLSAATDLAFSKDQSRLFVKRKDGSVEAWNAASGALVDRASNEDAQHGKLAGNPFAEPPAAAKPTDPNHLLLPALPGVDDARLLAWLKTKGIRVEQTAEGWVLTSAAGVTLSASSDGRILVLSNGTADVADRLSHTHFTVDGWNRSYSSRYGYDGDKVTWPGLVSASFGPRTDRLVLQSVAAQSLYFQVGASRLYDPSNGKLVASLDDETCQPNEIVWSPHGKYIARAECEGATLLLSDALTGKALSRVTGEMPICFGSDDATIAALFGGSARISGIGEVAPRVAIPGPLMLRAIAIASNETNLALLFEDGLDVWDLSSGGLAKHVDAVVAKDGNLARAASGRFYAYTDDREPLGITLLDAVSGTTRLEPANIAFHPTRDLLARVDDSGISVVDLATGNPVDKPTALGKKNLRVSHLSFTPDGSRVVALLSDASLVVTDAGGRLSLRIPSIDPQGCGAQPMQFPTADAVSMSCSSGIRTLSLTTGKPLPEAPWRDESARPPRPSFSPPRIETALKHPTTPYEPFWSATPSFLVAGVDPPLLARAKDGKVVSLHSFAYGKGRAIIVVDEAGRWDANALGASLVHVTVAGVDDAAEKDRRKVPGLLGAFARGQ